MPEEEDSVKIALRYRLMTSKTAEACSDISNDAKETRLFMDIIELLYDNYMKRSKKKHKVDEPESVVTSQDPTIKKSKSVRKGDIMKSASQKRTWSRKKEVKTPLKEHKLDQVMPVQKKRSSTPQLTLHVISKLHL